VAISGFGHGDDRRAYDGVVQAASGVMDLTGQPDGAPSACGVPIGDLGAALFAAFGTVNGIIGAMKSGHGARVDVAMMDCLLAIQSGVAAEYMTTGVYSSRIGAESPHRVPHNIYRTSDDRYVFLVSNNPIWARLCSALELGPLADDPRVQTNQDRVKHRDLVNRVLAGRIAELTVDDVCARLTAFDVPHSRVATLAEAIDSQYARDREMVLEIGDDLRDGREPIRVMGMPYKMTPVQPHVRYGPPVLGEANPFVIHDLLGLADDE
jgi:crotonobetainyl-CoA:carnitine CoA-transferase CaiB-like acyl-CoA transferase